MNENVQIVFGLLGGLAIFLFGMNMMSESLQKAAGEKMKTVLGVLTKNPVMGVLSGALVTAVLQSSSATTVMAIGFVSAGLMTLPQAISIIFGANIGTTMTAQIIAFNLSDYVYIIIFAGFILMLLARKEKLRYVGRTILAFGLLFDGIDIMGSVMKPLASSPFFLNLIDRVADNRFLGVLVGMLMTLVVQSSSATIAVLQNFASQAAAGTTASIIGLSGAIPILLGDNIGTTITAILASLTQNKNAKRTALAHCIFNVSGSLLFIWFVGPYSRLIQMLSPKGNEVDVISRQIANAHTGFNVIMTLIWTPLLPLMVKIVKKLLPGREEEAVVSASVPKYLDNQLIGQPLPSIHLVSREILHLGHMVQMILIKAESFTLKNCGELLGEVQKGAAAIRAVNERIDEYTSAMFADGSLTEEQASRVTEAILIKSDFLRIGLLCEDILSDITANASQKKQLSKEAVKDLKDSLHQIRQLYDNILRQMINGTLSAEADLQVKTLRQEIFSQDERLRRRHMKRVSKNKCASALTNTFNDMLNELVRMGTCCVNLSDLSVGDVSFHELLQGEPVPGSASPDEEESAILQLAENAGKAAGPVPSPQQ